MPAVTANPEQIKLLDRIAHRMLNLSSGTPVEYTRKTLGTNRTILDEMVNARLIRIFKGQYLPTFRGIQRLDSGVRSLVAENLNYVLSALKRLYIRRDIPTFALSEIVVETRALNPTLDKRDVLPVLVLGEEFGYYSFQNGIQFSAGEFVVHNATVIEKILDFDSVAEHWTKLVAREEADKSRTYSSAGKGDTTPIEQRAQEAALPVLDFMHNARLRGVVERDRSELQRVKRAQAVKSRYVLCGGLIEALLLDALLHYETRAKTANKAPKGHGSARALHDWRLGDLIDVAVELNIIQTDAEQYSHGVRNYRNLVHPGKEIRSQQKVAPEEADIAEKVLDIVIRELRANTRS